MAIFGVPLYNDDIWMLVSQFLVNLAAVTIVVRVVYRRYAPDNEYQFTFFMINALVFFICFTLRKFDLGLGMALGLFAIFGILRYRTTTIPIKEMTYLFMVIGLGVINALANDKMSYAELAATNLCIIGLAAALEHILYSNRELRESIRYERVDLIRPEKHAELVADLEARTGLKIHGVD